MGKRHEKKLPHQGPQNWLPMWQGSRATMFWYINWKHNPCNPPQKRKQKQKEQDIFNSENQCRICGIAWESPEDQESDSLWIGCAGKTCKCKPATACKHECDWWVHNRCAHIYYENSDTGERAMSTWAKKHFFCHKHMPDVQKVGWVKKSSNRMWSCHPIWKKVLNSKGKPSVRITSLLKIYSPY